MNQLFIYLIFALGLTPQPVQPLYDIEIKLSCFQFIKMELDDLNL